MDCIEKHITEILNKMEKGKAVLFLGAGSSASAGAPLEREFVAEIKSKFPR